MESRRSFGEGEEGRPDVLRSANMPAPCLKEKATERVQACVYERYIHIQSAKATASERKRMRMCVCLCVRERERESAGARAGRQTCFRLLPHDVAALSPSACACQGVHVYCVRNMGYRPTRMNARLNIVASLAELGSMWLLFGAGGWDLVFGVWGIYVLREKREDGRPDVLLSANMPDSRTTAPQYCEAVPGGP